MASSAHPNGARIFIRIQRVQHCLLVINLLILNAWPCSSLPGLGRALRYLKDEYISGIFGGVYILCSACDVGPMERIDSRNMQRIAP